MTLGLLPALLLLCHANAQEWQSLFDGKSTKGWVEVTGKPFPSHSWTIEDGCLKSLVRTDGFQDIRTVEKFRSFELEFEWKLLKDGNSGVKYLIQNIDEWTNKEGRQARARGLEYQLVDRNSPDAKDHHLFTPGRSTLCSQLLTGCGGGLENSATSTNRGS